jgi:hypothetical protein
MASVELKYTIDCPSGLWSSLVRLPTDAGAQLAQRETPVDYEPARFVAKVLLKMMRVAFAPMTILGSRLRRRSPSKVSKAYDLGIV